MEPEVLVAKMRAQRESWVELDDPPRRALKIRRPGELGLLAYTDGGRRIASQIPQLLQDTVVDWRNFTEADLLGAGIGGDSAVPFSPDVFAEYLIDHSEVMTVASAALINALNANSAKRKDAEKNSRKS